jgi:hypothetical protein
MSGRMKKALATLAALGITASGVTEFLTHTMTAFPSVTWVHSVCAVLLTVLGLATSIFPVSVKNPDPASGAAPDARTKQAGKVDVYVLFALAAVIGMAALIAAGCSAMNDTLKVEDTLAITTSQVAHAVDGADALLEAKTRVQLATDASGARAYYASYKPKIEKARLAVHTAQDTITDAEEVRAKIPSSAGGTCANGCTGVATDYQAWLPPLSQALSALTQAYDDVKGLVQ